VISASALECLESRLREMGVKYTPIRAYGPYRAGFIVFAASGSHEMCELAEDGTLVAPSGRQCTFVAPKPSAGERIVT
jgi:hypothetical protein